MSKIKLTLPTGESVCNGKQVTFRAPCNCEGVTDVVIEGNTYSLVDAEGNTVGTISTFKKDAMVTVVLDTENNKAYIQNASVHVDDIPVFGSSNLITSGGVYSAIMSAIEGSY